MPTSTSARTDIRRAATLPFEQLDVFDVTVLAAQLAPLVDLYERTRLTVQMLDREAGAPSAAYPNLTPTFRRTLYENAYAPTGIETDDLDVAERTLYEHLCALRYLATLGQESAPHDLPTPHDQLLRPTTSHLLRIANSYVVALSRRYACNRQDVHTWVDYVLNADVPGAPEDERHLVALVATQRQQYARAGYTLMRLAHQPERFAQFRAVTPCVAPDAS